MAHGLARTSSSASRPLTGTAIGCGQLTLVEHALCPLDARVSLAPNLVHDTRYQFTDQARRRQTVHAKVLCPLGLSAHDEFYLWGLLALSCQHAHAVSEFQATPHYCLRMLGLIDAQSRRGGRQYHQFAAALERLSAVRYICDRFYDPVRAEHRRVSFGLLSYCLPLDANSGRAWRFCWDALFFEFAQATGGAMRFDLTLCRELSVAARRLLLFVSKVFTRSRTTSRMSVEQLAVNVLGLAPSLPVKAQLAKLRRTCTELSEHGVLSRDEPPEFRKLQPGVYEVLLVRGPYFRQRSTIKQSTIESPLAELLRSIGLDETVTGRVLQQYPTNIVQEWADITLAAQERFGARFFSRSAAAYFLDNLRQATTNGRTPPEWWHEVRKAEQRAQAERDRRRRQLRAAAHPASNRPATDTFSKVGAVLTGLNLKIPQSKLALLQIFLKQYFAKPTRPVPP